MLDAFKRAQAVADAVPITVQIHARHPADKDKAAALERLVNAEMATPERQAEVRATLKQATAEATRRLICGDFDWDKHLEAPDA